MDENTSLDTIEIPNDLLEIRGLRTASVIVDASTISEARRLIVSHKIVEAGALDFLRNLIKTQRYNPDEVEALLSKVRGFANPAGAAAEPDLQKRTELMTQFLQNLNQKTNKPFLYKPWQKGMEPQWEQIKNLAARVEAGEPGAYQSLQVALGNAGISAESALGKYWGAIKLFTPSDKKLLDATVPGITRVGNQRGGVTFKELFEGADQMTHGGINSANIAPGNLVVSDPTAAQAALQQLGENIGASATLRGVVQTAATGGAILAGLPHIAGAAAAAWGISQGLKNAPTGADFDQATNVSQTLNPNAAPGIQNGSTQAGEASNGLGGTTNGKNLGGLGGQYVPNSGVGWTPPKPNLPNNPNDWLPTNTSDYYNMVNRGSANDADNVRLAQMVAPTLPNIPVDNIDDVVQNVLTILKQGQPGEATMKQAMDYIRAEDAKAQQFVAQYQKSQQPQQVSTPQAQVKDTPGLKEN